MVWAREIVSTGKNSFRYNLVLKRTPAIEKAIVPLQEFLTLPLNGRNVNFSRKAIKIDEEFFYSMGFVISLVRSLYETLSLLISSTRLETITPVFGHFLERAISYVWDFDQKVIQDDKIVLLTKWFKYHMTLPMARLLRKTNPNTELPKRPKGNNPFPS